MRLRHTDKDVPSELAGMATRLRDERPEATELELDRAKRRVLAGVRRTQGSGGFMRTRVALTAILALGIVTSGTGGALAVVSGIHAAQDNAGEAVYPTTPSGESEGSGGNGGGGGGGSGGGGSSNSGTLGNSASDSSAVSPAAQANSTDNGTLPFTGYLAIPVLLVGVAMLAVGLILRRRADSPDLS
jgi:hypothetical protein